MMSGNSSPSHSNSNSTDTSLSLSPDLLADGNSEKIRQENPQQQHSSISEHISSLNSLENDRSLVEIEINNIPELTVDASLNSALKNVKSVLEEILHNEQFISVSEKERSDKLDSNDDVSLNIFDGLNLDDSSINNYVLKLKQPEPEEAPNKDLNVFNLERSIESLRDMASNPSTMSLNTTLTEYKQIHEEYATKLVSYENAVAHRDSVIAKLKESVTSAQMHEGDLRAQCEQYSKDIQCLQRELAEDVEYIKKCKQCKCLERINNDNDNTISYKEDDLNAMYTQLNMGPEQLEVLKNTISDYVNSRLNANNAVHQLETNKLQEKHVKEMDDTRKFYEKKCADILSDELVSHSRKSDEELQSEDEMPEIYENGGGGGGDAGPQSFNTSAMKKLSTVEETEKFQEEINMLRQQLDILQQEKQTIDATTQANSGEYEIDGIVKSYQVQLAEQIAYAKCDILAALEDNISMLAASNCDDADWPKEFLEIRNKLSEKYIKEIATQQKQHEAAIAQLKQEHIKATTRATRRSLDFSDNGNNDVLKERKTTNTLRNLLVESYKYFAQCEEELNTTLFEELAKQSQIDSDSDVILNDTSTSSSSRTNDTFSIKRVHLTPNISEFIDKIDSNVNVSLEFKHELGACLHRLRTEANAILELTTKSSQNDHTHAGAVGVTQKSLEERIQSLTQQIRTDSQLKEELTTQLTDAKHFVKMLESERRNLEKQLEDVIAKNRITESELSKARDKIGELIEYRYKETVSEGYGESTPNGGAGRTPFSELLERARYIVNDNKSDAATLEVISDLCRECEQLVDEGKREREDFMLQIDSADKKLKATQRFLEEQAVEREQERDEAQKMISALQEELKDRDKDRVGYERVNEETLMDSNSNSTKTKMTNTNACCQHVHFQEEIVQSVERVELQMREMSVLIADGEKRIFEVNTEREEAVEKIGLLRDIIKDLEQQIEVKIKAEEEFKDLVNKQREANDELAAQLDIANNSTNFQNHILQLEEEVSKLRRASDIVGNEGLIKQIQLQLHDLELTVDKNIREIEASYATKSATTCSTPSEEMSVQDQIRPKTPNSTIDDCEIPLQQLARLKEKLLKHSRAESSALKRIQDLELQLLKAKEEYDEVQNEKDVLQEQASEQLVLISSLQMRLDDQRIRAEHGQKQANASLEMRIYDLENDLQTLQDKLQSRESTIKQLTKIVDETKQRLKDREDELSTTLEESEVCELKTEIDKLKADNEELHLKIENDARNAKILPSLVDNIIADKNKDIECLRQKLEETERQFDIYRSINSEKSDDPARGALSFFNISTPEQMRSANTMGSLNLTAFVPEISSIEKVGPPNVNYTTDAPLIKPNSTELHKSTERHVRFEDEARLEEELVVVRDKLREETNTTQELRVDLAEVKMHLTERDKELLAVQDDARRKDDMYMKLAKEKREIEKQFETLDTIRKSVEELQRNEEHLKAMLHETKEQFAAKAASYERLQKEFDNFSALKEQDYSKSSEEIAKLKLLLEDRECELEILNEDITRYQNENADLEEKLKAKPNEQLQTVMHKKEVVEKELQIVKLKATIDDLKREIIHLQDYLTEKDKIIDTMKIDSETLRVNLETIKQKMSEAGNVYDLREKLVRERELNALLQSDNVASIDEIGDQVRKQLDDSANLDDKIFSVLSSGEFNNVTDADALKSALTTERKSKYMLEKKVKELESKLDESLDTIKQLQVALDDQRKLCNEIQVEDTNLMDQMRSKLEEALENEIEYETLLNNEKLLRSQLENEAATRCKKDSSLSASSKTEYRSLGNIQEQRLQSDLKQLQEETANLKREVKNLKKAKHTAESGLKYTKEMLNLKAQEVEKLEARISSTGDELKQMKDAFKQHKRELDTKRREVENSRALIDELEQEKLQLNVKVNLLESNKDINTAVPEVFMRQMKELGELVSEHISENKLMTDTVMKLTDERNRLQQKLCKFEEREPFDDPIARANHLFGKYLRADSYRNALAYQKKYLISLLATYQGAIAHPLSKFEPKRAAHTRKSNRFRSVATVCIAIFRMKYMVQRWHSGSRSGAYLSLQRNFRAGAAEQGTHFQVGQPVSGEHFRAGLAPKRPFTRHTLHINQGASTSGAIPWSGLSPPSKDTALKAANTIHEQVESLRPPSVQLESYIERFNLIQQRLGSTLHNLKS